MSEGDWPVELGEGHLMKESPKAILVMIGKDEVWIPKSVIHDDSEVYNQEHDSGRIVVKQWWAEKNGYS